jgi:hypothetical protein
MAYSQPENQSAAFASKLFARWAVSAVLCLGWVICANAQDAQPNKNESWTTTSENSEPNANPSRTMESHTKSGGRSVDKQRVEVLGPNGQYQPDSEVEKETIRVNDNTTRTVVRTYTWDANGQKKLAQQSEEESRSAASGDAHVVRTTSSSDLNGHLQVVQREVAETKRTGPDAQETKTTVYTADGNGGFTTSRKVQETQKLGAGHRVEEKKTTLVPDGNGNFKVAEVQEKTIAEDGKKRTSEERVLRPDLDGRLSESSRSVSDEIENAAGEKTKTVDTYSTEVPGFTGDGRLHHNQRVTTVQQKDSNGEIIEQQIEAPSPGNPTDDPHVQAKTKYTVHYASSGTDQTKTTQTRDANGNLNVAATQTKKSDQPPPSAQSSPQKPK